ncbi:MAG: EFR1 family ferrodoxin [Clostridia bacterium]|nr:EFR1 family ferrodoxin [Clostridia bacterium]
MVVYFTGTGNSRYAAELLADALEDECIDSAGYIKNGIAADLVSGKPWVFVAPIYAWSFPAVFGDFIRSGSFHGETKAYFVLTCGSDMGAAWDKTEALCAEAGLTHMGTYPCVMPDNYIVMFSAPAPEKSAKIISEAEVGLGALAEKIAAGEILERPSNGFGGKIKSGPVNSAFGKYYISDKKFASGEKCVSCGLCEKVCPLGNIEISEGKPKWKGHCTHCMACISSCPKEAIEYGKATRGKRRYLCQKYEKKQIGG